MKAAVVYGTLTMNTELVAETIQSTLETIDKFEEVELLNVLDIEDLNDLNNYDFVILGTSTWGEGDYPPDTEEFADKLEQEKPDYSKITFSFFGLGETTYENFCGAIKNLRRIIVNDLGAKEVGKLFTIDGYPEDDILEDVIKWVTETANQL